MRKFLLATWFVFLFIAIHAQQITLETTQTSSEEGVIEEFWYWSGGFPVLGEGFAPNSTVTVFATDPNGVPWRNFTGTADAQGSFSIQISAKKIRSILGEHTVTATDDQGNTVTEILTVTANVNEVLDVSTMPEELTMSEFAGSGILLHASGIVPNAEIKINISSPNTSSEIEPDNPKYADENGEFEMNFNLFTQSYPWGDQMPDVPGKWTITVHDWSGNSNYGQANFRIWPDNPDPSDYCAIQQQDTTLGVYPITLFEIDGVNSNSSSVSATDYYEDFSDIVFNVNAGETYTVRLKGENPSSYAADTYTLFIDWNQNGILDEDNEIIHEGYIFNSTGEDDKFTEFQITIPETALSGNTRLRILKVSSATTYSMFWPTGACGYYFNQGQAEDYTLSIEGGIILPDCSFTDCPEDISIEVNASSAVVDYDLAFDCENMSGICELEYTGNNENFLPVANPVVANDFDLPEGSTSTVTQVTANIVRAMFTSGANIYFYADNNGTPGELVTSFENVAYTSQTEVGSISEYPVYECVLDLPESVELEGGKYWLGLNIGGPLIYWETTSDITTEVAYSTFNSGTSWDANDGHDGVFKVVYECAVDPSGETEIVLVEGLESGSEFPVGTTRVKHNLEYNGVVLDACVFDVTVTEILPDCIFTECPDDISLEVNTISAVVEYDVAFNCENMSGICELEYTGNSENFLPVANPVVANDFDLPIGSTSTVTQVTANIVRAMITSGANIYFYADNNGTPGELVTSFENVAYTSQTEVGSISEYPVYECVLDLPESVELEGGKYWLGLNIGGPLIYWETTSDITTEVAYSTFNSGTSWEANDGHDGVFKVAYECAIDPSGETEIVLVEGLESGSEFPVGKTTVTHNLIYHDNILDVCTFDVDIINTPVCNFSDCPNDITVETVSGSAAVEYDVAFECEDHEAICKLDFEGNLENAYSVSNEYITANDFTVPAGDTMYITSVIPNLANQSSRANIYFYNDNNGNPGSVIASFENLSYSSQTEIGTLAAGNYPVYEVVMNLPNPIELTAGKYWLAIHVVEPSVFWEVSTKVSTDLTYSSIDGGQTWNPIGSVDGVFKLGYVCNGSDHTHLILTDGLYSGSEFPEGTTTVKYNLVFDGNEILDECAFNVIVKNISNVSEFYGPDLLVYPSPVKDNLNIKNNEVINQIMIYDLFGNEVCKREIYNKIAQIDLSNLSSGSYIVKIATDRNIKSIKIIKK